MRTSCHGCGVELRIDGPVGRRTTCPGCDADLHSCMNCRHWDESSARECREPHADRVIDKVASNACELFQLGDGAPRRRGASRAALDRLGALFGEAPAKEEDPRDALERIFRRE